MRLTHEVRKSVRFIPMLLLAFVTTFAYAKNYNTIVVFGDSLSDTGNVAHLTDETLPFRFPSPVLNYTEGRFTDGVDTTPYARNYFGVWVEQFAATLPSQPEVRNSLDGGTDYAYGFATSGVGTGTYDFPNGLSVEVNNIDRQITDYLATHPKIDNSTLFIVWGGANDLVHAESPGQIPSVAYIAAGQMASNIERLIKAGATQFIVGNLPPLGMLPRNAKYPPELRDTLSAITKSFFNDALAVGIAGLRAKYPHRDMTIFELDVFTLFEQIADSPSSFSLTNITAPSQYTPTNPTYLENPDKYLFWDDLHPTTHGHGILADAASHLISQHQCNAKGENCVYPPPCVLQGNHCASPVN